MSTSICLLQAIAFLDLLAVSLIIPLIPNHVRLLGGSHISVGLLGSIYAGCQLVSGPLMGSLSDLKGQKLMLVVTLLVCSLAYVTIGLTSSITIILIARAVLGIFKQTQMLTRALVPEYEKNKNKQSSIYGKMNAISGAGITLGPVIGGHIVEDDPENGFTLVGIIVCFCFIFNSGLVYFLLPKTRGPTIRKSSNNINSSNSLINSVCDSAKQSVMELYKVRWYKYWDVFVFKALVGFAMGIYYSNYSLYLKTQHELSPKYIGYVISFQGVIGSLSAFFMDFINSFYPNDKDYSLRNFHVFLLMSVSLIGLISSINIYIYAVWLIPLAISNAVARLVTLEMVLNRGHNDHRGTLIGASNSIRSLSGVIAPMVAGFTGHIFGVSYVMYGSLCASMTGFFMSYHYKRKSEKND